MKLHVTANLVHIANKYIQKKPGHKNSKGESAPWVIIQKGTGKILSSHTSEEAAEKAFEAMESHMAGEDPKDPVTNPYDHDTEPGYGYGKIRRKRKAGAVEKMLGKDSSLVDEWVSRMKAAGKIVMKETGIRTPNFYAGDSAEDIWDFYALDVPTDKHEILEEI
jgi:hypothetical protein